MEGSSRDGLRCTHLCCRAARLLLCTLGLAPLVRCERVAAVAHRAAMSQVSLPSSGNEVIQSLQGQGPG
jgi:hypothetical protein